MTGIIPQDCKVCRRDKQKRIDWGCEAPTSNPYVQIECPRCFAYDTNCEKCGGTGVVPYNTCPFKVIRPRVIELSHHLAAYQNGSYPFSGGTMEQSAWFLEAISHLSRVVNDIQEEKLKNAHK